MSNDLISLDNINLSSGKPRLTSPRSIEALDKLGYDLEELYYLDFKSFKFKHIEILNQPETIQQSRYEYFENHRKAKLDECLKVNIYYKEYIF